MPDASLLLPSLAGLFGVANLLDIYATTLPPTSTKGELGTSSCSSLDDTLFLVQCCWSQHGCIAWDDRIPSYSSRDGWT